MWNLIITGAYLVGEFVYHRYMDPPPPKQPERELTIPLTALSTPIPLLYGRCRVTAPVLAYTSVPIAEPVDEGFIYQLDMLFVLGVPFQGGTQHIIQAYVGDRLMRQFSSGGHFLSSQNGNGNFENADVHLSFETPIAGMTSTQGNIEFLNGKDTQTLIDPGTLAPTTQAGRYMTSTELLDVTDDQPWNHAVGRASTGEIPGYRGYLCAFLWAENETAHWAVGLNPQVASYSYEVSSYPAASLRDSGGEDCNPIDILLDLLTGKFCKLGYDVSYIDMPSFIAAANVLHGETNWMSIAFQSQETALELIGKVLEQIDGGIFEDPTTGTLKLKLIRPDFDPATVPHITPDNCEGLQNFAAGGWTDVINRVVVTFTDRLNGYKQGQAVAYSQANAVGQDGEVREITIDMPGVTFQYLADIIAARELDARSRPMMKCRAIVNRSFLRVSPGDAVKLTWPDANVAGVIFRVAAISRGTLQDNSIALDLVQDPFYTHRNYVDELGGVVHAGEIVHYGG